MEKKNPPTVVVTLTESHASQVFSFYICLFDRLVISNGLCGFVIDSSPAWALAAAAAAAEQDEFTDEDSDLGSEEEEDSYDHVSPGELLVKYSGYNSFEILGI